MSFLERGQSIDKEGYRRLVSHTRETYFRPVPLPKGFDHSAIVVNPIALVMASLLTIKAPPYSNFWWLP
jgi:hypothetical protein